MVLVADDGELVRGWMRGLGGYWVLCTWVLGIGLTMGLEVLRLVGKTYVYIYKVL